MAVLQRDTHYHTYADYLTWSGRTRLKAVPGVTIDWDEVLAEIG